MHISACVGNYAQNPYCVSDLGINLYSMEELCYCLKENAYLLDPSIAGDKLVEWVDHECGLTDLARVLNTLIYRKDAFVLTVKTILEYVGFYDAKTIENVLEIIRQGAGRSNVERKKSQIDYLVSRNKLIAAIRAYNKLLESYQGTPNSELYAKIVHNKGVAYANLMLYEAAGECFLQAHQINPEAGYFKDYLAAKRLELKEDDYVAFVSEHMENYDTTLDLEKQMEEFLDEWEQQPEYLRLYNRAELRQESDPSKLLEEDRAIVQILKDSYRNSVSE